MKYINHGSGGDANVLHIAETSIPTLRAGQVLIEVHYAGVNRPDVIQRQGKYPPPHDASPILGLEVAGIIIAIADDVTTWKMGDAVCALVHGGGYAEYCVAESSHCLPIPQGMSLSEAACLPETFFTVWSNVFMRGHLQAGESLLVHGGSSGIGLTAIQLAKVFGARVITTVRNLDKAAVCTRLGADTVINYKQEDFEQVVAAVTQRGVDMVLDMVGGSYIQKNLRCLAMDGRLIQIAFLQGSRDPAFDLSLVMFKRLTITGSTLRPRSIVEKAIIANELREKVWPLLDTGQLKVPVYAEFPLANAALAHELMESSQHIGKMVLRVKERPVGSTATSGWA